MIDNPHKGAPKLNETPARNVEVLPQQFTHNLEQVFTRGNTIGVPVDFGGTALALVKSKILSRRDNGIRRAIIVCNPHATALLYLSFTNNPIVGQGIPLSPNGGNIVIQENFYWNGELWVTSAADYSWSGVEFYQ